MLSFQEQMLRFEHAGTTPALLIGFKMIDDYKFAAIARMSQRRDHSMARLYSTVHWIPP